MIDALSMSRKCSVAELCNYGVKIWELLIKRVAWKIHVAFAQKGNNGSRESYIRPRSISGINCYRSNITNWNDCRAMKLICLFIIHGRCQDIHVTMSFTRALWRIHNIVLHLCSQRSYPSSLIKSSASSSFLNTIKAGPFLSLQALHTPQPNVTTKRIALNAAIR
jgi:hypothetical protein